MCRNSYTAQTRDKRDFIEDFMLAAASWNSGFTIQEMIWAAETTWNEIEKVAPYER